MANCKVCGRYFAAKNTNNRICARTRCVLEWESWSQCPVCNDFFYNPLPAKSPRMPKNFKVFRTRKYCSEICFEANQLRERRERVRTKSQLRKEARYRKRVTEPRRLRDEAMERIGLDPIDHSDEIRG